MSLFANPWCFFSILLVIVLLLIAAALLNRQRAAAPAAAPPEQPQPVRNPAVTATAPFEALAALHERLSAMHQHLPAESEDARWLAGYIHDLRSVMDDVYWELEQARGTERTVLLTRLDDAVARFNHALARYLSTTIDRATDRTALHTQLEQLRRTLH